MSLISKLALAAIVALTPLSALAHDITLGSLTLSPGWTRATPPNAQIGGGFLTIANNGSEDDRLIAVAAPFSGHAELHEMSVVDNVMTMRHMEGGIPIPAGQTVELKPGAYHVMFMDLTGPLKQGDTLTVTLTFEKAGSVEVPFNVEKIGAKEPSQEHGAH
ncbi:copper chaperone PCu(A)C [Stappia sp. F7233]|uniref:Copper chaperone PCu(A)C n=1 Tax=Stappia albiluteola TaxID=2758565 RepID=A0A839AAX1_9HYPH|nr:copper chaperone PCu(A)C [Stappia albiluteola]MBA5776336.1 copper chaperone PCu(A)C [Stappia albiluteola]